MSRNKPFWLLAAPAIFLVLWSGGFSIAKFGVAHAEPLTFLALRYAIVLVILLPIYGAPPTVATQPCRLDQRRDRRLPDPDRLFRALLLAFKAGVSAGGVAIIVCLQPILVGLIAPHFAARKGRAP